MQGGASTMATRLVSEEEEALIYSPHQQHLPTRKSRGSSLGSSLGKERGHSGSFNNAPDSDDSDAEGGGGEGGTSGVLGLTWNFVNCVVGSGIVGLPYVFVQSGFLLGLMMLTGIR